MAIAKTLEMGAAMDGAAVKAGVKAHSEAIGAIDKNGVTSQAAFKKINAALGHMIASAGEAKTMAVYDAWSDVVPAGIPAYLKSTVNGRSADAAYNALMQFKDVVRTEAGGMGAAPPAKAIGNVDAKGVLPLEDFVAINSALGHMIKSSGTSATMGTYDAFKGLVADNIPSYLMSTVN